MHDLSEFIESLLERFTKWFNRTHSRSGHLWEDRFKSVIVESGTAARTLSSRSFPSHPHSSCSRWVGVAFCYAGGVSLRTLPPSI
jgi:hypothetical protein